MLTIRAKERVKAARGQEVEAVEAKAQRVKPKRKEQQQKQRLRSCASNGAMEHVPMGDKCAFRHYLVGDEKRNV